MARPETVKTCTGCRERKPLEAFYANASSKDGRCTRCKACMSAYAKRWYAGNRDRVRVQVQAYRHANRTEYNQYMREYRRRKKAGQAQG